MSVVSAEFPTPIEELAKRVGDLERRVGQNAIILASQYSGEAWKRVIDAAIADERAMPCPIRP